LNVQDDGAESGGEADLDTEGQGWGSGSWEEVLFTIVTSAGYQCAISVARANSELDWGSQPTATPCRVDNTEGTKTQRFWDRLDNSLGLSNGANGQQNNQHFGHSLQARG